MAKFNGTKKPVAPTAVNEMGEKAYVMEAKENLIATTLTTFLQASYYEKEKTITDAIIASTKKVDSLFVAKLAIYLRTKANMRSVSHLLAGELAPRIAGQEYAKRFYEKIIVRPDDMSEILGYYAFKNGGKLTPLPNSIKKGFKSRLEALDPYQIDKYKMKSRELSLVDLVNLFHPKSTQVNKEAYRRLMAGESLDGLYSTKIFEKEMSAAGKIASERVDISVEEAKEDAIESVLGNVKGMPVMNLVRNLRNILLIAPDSVKEACAQLTIKEKILFSRLLPFRFATAYSEIEQLANPKGVTKSKIKFEDDSTSNFESNKAMILKALETALEYSIANIPGFVGNTAILIDHSGSVRGDGGGASKVSAFSKVSTAMIGNLFGSMLAYRQDNVYVGMFGDRLIPVPMDRKMGVLAFNQHSFNAGAGCGGGTENGLYIFLNECIKENKKVNNLVIFSDMVIGSGGAGGWDASSSARLGSFQTLFKQFKAINPTCHTVCVNLRATGGKSVFDKSLNVTEVAGWSDKIFDIISANSRGYADLIKEIEAIVI